MNRIRMIVQAAVILLICLDITNVVSAEEPPTTPREREIREREAQREAEVYGNEVEQARLHYEQAETKYRMMMKEYEERRGELDARERRGPSAEEIEARIDDLAKRLHDLRRHEVEVRTTMEQLTVSGRPKDAEGLQLEMIELHRRIEMTQLELEQHYHELERVRERREIGHMRERLEYISHWREVAFEPQQAVTLATQSLVEMHVAKDDTRGAVKVFEHLLEEVSAAGTRTALRFALKELYSDLDQPDRAIDQMVQVILENSQRFRRD